MTHLDESQKQRLRNEYFDLVQKSLQIQKTGNIRAFTAVAKEAEHIAQQIQNLSRARKE
ncbi:MAG: DUF6435 family protein [Cyclobacteriaceae bacterium]|nr:DUF6435 family protein [Cyclobacteriaceae bacterium]